MTKMYLTRVPMTLALITLAGILPAAAANTALNDTQARAHLERMERDGVIADPVWARAYSARARTAPTAQARVADLRWALRFDPDFSPARWDLTLALLAQRDSEFAGQASEAVTRSLRAFPAQQRIVLWVLTIGAGMLLLTLVAVAALNIAKTIPRIHHGIRERLFFLPAEVRSGAAILTIALPFLVALTLPPTAALFWALLFGTVATWTRLDRIERRSAVTALGALLLAPAVLALWVRMVDPAIPSSYLRSLWVAQMAESPGAAAVVRLAPPEGAVDDPDRLASLALVDRRAGRYGDAEGKLRQATALAPEGWSYRNNLGNILLLQGELDAALAEYRRAVTLAPGQPLPHVNLAQAWVHKLEFRLADGALAEATRLGYRLPPVLSNDPEDIIVRDHLLGASEFWSRLLRGEAGGEAFGWRRGLGMSLAMVVPMRPAFLTLPLFLALWWVALARTLPRASRCAGCATMICRKCHYRVLRRSYCGECYAILREVRAPLKRVELLDARKRHTGAVTHPLMLVLAILLPGSGHALHGAHRRASTYLAIAALLLLAVGAGTLWPDPRVLLTDTGGSGRWIAFGLVWAALAWGSVRGTVRLSRRTDDEAEPTTPRSA